MAGDMKEALARFYREAWRDGAKNVTSSEPSNEAREAIEYLAASSEERAAKAEEECASLDESAANAIRALRERAESAERAIEEERAEWSAGVQKYLDDRATKIDTICAWCGLPASTREERIEHSAKCKSSPAVQRALAAEADAERLRGALADAAEELDRAVVIWRACSRPDEAYHAAEKARTARAALEGGKP